MHGARRESRDRPASRKDVRYTGPYFVDAYAANLAGSPTIVHPAADLGHHAERASQKCLATKLQKGFIRPMRVLLPPPRRKPARCGEFRAIGTGISPTVCTAVIPESNLFRTAQPAEDGDVPVIRTRLSSCRKNSWTFLMLGHCSHEFSWPRAQPLASTTRSVPCARPRMSTTGRPCVAEAGSTSRLPIRRRSGAVRSHAAHVDAPLTAPTLQRASSFRGKNLSTWYEGVIQNISQSGVLFNGPQQCRRTRWWK